MALPIIESVEVASRELNRNALVVMVILLVGAVCFLGYVIWIQEHRLLEALAKADNCEKEKMTFARDQYQQNLTISIKLADAERSLREAQATQNKKR